ncbi:D-2-hydroxyacid dehydrogenase [Dokdonella sp.]|uniref:D-2-hydroxyacid dehydrogenase n=1 Tax=Dokdonella sp. TaxID=2291710 RepID=UPI0035284A8E
MAQYTAYPSLALIKAPCRTPAILGLLLLAMLAPGLALAKGPPPDPRATALIEQLGLKESPVASRDLPGWKKPSRVVVTRSNPELLKQLQAAAPGVEILPAAEGEALAKQLATTQAVIGLCNAETLAAAPSLRWIQTWWVGVERCISVPGLDERGIVISNAQRTSAVPIAEHAMAMTMSLARGLPQYERLQMKADWADDIDTIEMRELTGQTMLVVGLGGIGTEVARRAHGIGMRVIATRNSSREGPEFVAKVGLADELLALAAEADVVVNATPLTPATTGIFNRAFFAAMKPGGYFVNIGRGRSVVTDDLVEALRGKRLAGAGLDVTDPEPLPKDSPLWQMGNVIITPHVASVSAVQGDRYVILVTENLRRYVAGEPLLNVVDIERGY